MLFIKIPYLKEQNCWFCWKSSEFGSESRPPGLKLLAMRLQHRCFSVDFAKCLRTLVLIEHLLWLFLYVAEYWKLLKWRWRLSSNGLDRDTKGLYVLVYCTSILFYILQIRYIPCKLSFYCRCGNNIGRCFICSISIRVICWSKRFAELCWSVKGECTAGL